MVRLLSQMQASLPPQVTAPTQIIISMLYAALTESCFTWLMQMLKQSQCMLSGTLQYANLQLLQISVPMRSVKFYYNNRNITMMP